MDIVSDSLPGGRDYRLTMSGCRLVLGYWSEGLQRDVGFVGTNILASSVILSEREQRRFSIMANIRTVLQKSARFSLETSFNAALYQEINFWFAWPFW